MNVSPSSLRTVADRLAAGVLGDDGVVVGNALGGWLRGDGSFEDCLGIGATWRQDMAREERDRTLRQIAATYFSDLSARKAAETIAEKANRFRASADWRASRAKADCPFCDGLRADWWRLLRAFDRDLSARTVRRALGQTTPL